MEQKIIFGLVLGWFWAGFGLVLGQLAVLKKNKANYEQLLRSSFFLFSWAKNKQFIFFENIVVSAIKSCTISLL